MNGDASECSPAHARRCRACPPCVALARGASLERENELPFRSLDGSDREAIALAQQNHVFKLFRSMFAQLVERDHAREAALELHVHHEPARLLGVALRVVMK